MSEKFGNCVKRLGYSCKLNRNRYTRRILAAILFIFVLIELKSYIHSYEKHETSSLPLSAYNYDIRETLDKFCDPTDTHVKYTCLEELKKIDLKIEDDKKKINDYNECIECQKDKSNQKLTFYHHTFWHVRDLSSVTDFNRQLMKLNIMSYLATQNLCCTKFIFWKLPTFPRDIENELILLFSNYITKGVLEFKNFDLKELCASDLSSFKTTEMCKYALNNNLDLSSSDLTALSDLVRFMVLDIYNGIYTDGDVIYLKNMKLFWDFNFVYRWSFTNNYNTAVMGINKLKDPFISELYDYMTKRYTNVFDFIHGFHPYTLSNIVQGMNADIYSYKPLKTVSSLVVDPVWLCHDGFIPRIDYGVCVFSEFNSKKMIEAKDFHPDKFYPGAFTYHLHLGGTVKLVDKESYFKHFENYYKSVLKLNL